MFYLSWQMLWSTQAILGFYWKAAPENECYEGHAGADEKNEVFYRLETKIWCQHQDNHESFITGSSPRSRLLITKKRSSHGVIIILADCPCSLLSLISHHTSHIFCDADDDDDADDDWSHQTSWAPGRDLWRDEECIITDCFLCALICVQVNYVDAVISQSRDAESLCLSVTGSRARRRKINESSGLVLRVRPLHYGKLRGNISEPF